MEWVLELAERGYRVCIHKAYKYRFEINVHDLASNRVLLIALTKEQFETMSTQIVEDRWIARYDEPLRQLKSK